MTWPFPGFLFFSFHTGERSMENTHISATGPYLCGWNCSQFALVRRVLIISFLPLASPCDFRHPTEPGFDHAILAPLAPRLSSSAASSIFPACDRKLPNASRLVGACTLLSYEFCVICYLYGLVAVLADGHFWCPPMTSQALQIVLVGPLYGRSV